QVAVASFGDAPEDGAVSGRHLLGDEPDPGRKISSSRECSTTADRRHHRTRNDRADSRYRHDPSTIVVAFCQRLDLIGHGFNALIELPPITGKISDDAYHAGRKNIRPLGQDVGQTLAKETQSLPDDNPTLQ